MFINVSIEIPRMFSLVIDGSRSRNKIGWSVRRLACWLVELQQASSRKMIRKRKRAQIFSFESRSRRVVRESASLRRFLWPLYHGLSRPCCPRSLLSIHYSLFWCHKTWCKLVKLVISFGWFFFSTNYIRFGQCFNYNRRTSEGK